MRIRFASLLIVLLAGFLAYLGVSRAPLRVHITTAATWIPSLLLLAALFWEPRLRAGWKWLLIGAVLMLAGVAMAYSTALVVGEAEFGVRLWAAYTGILVIALATVLLLANLGEKVLRLLLSGSR